MLQRKQKNRQILCWIGQVAGKKKIYIFMLAVLQMASSVVSVADALFLRNIMMQQCKGFTEILSRHFTFCRINCNRNYFAICQSVTRRIYKGFFGK